MEEYTQQTKETSLPLKEAAASSSLPQKGAEGAFDDIRPYAAGEVKQAVESLLADRQFSRVLQGLVPWLPRRMRNGLVRLAFVGVNTPLQFQLRFIKPVLKHILRRCAGGYSFSYTGIEPGEGRYTFISNHRDIVLDSAILDLMLVEGKFPTTCEIAIGDNLLIYPWIKTLVRLNKAFTVRRGLSSRELLESSQRMSSYMHYAITEKHENIWIAQREGRAKDSSDQTQESLLKMFAMAGEGSIVERIKELNLVPLSISYEYDPCDYLKAQELQQKRDNPSFKKTKQDDLDNMRTGIFGQKGRIHYEAMPPVNTWIDELADLPRTEVYGEMARRIDREIHAGYRLFPGNYIALDMLQGSSDHSDMYTRKEKEAFEAYLQSRIDLITLEAGDEAFLRERILTMYANPVINKLKATSPIPSSPKGKGTSLCSPSLGGVRGLLLLLLLLFSCKGGDDNSDIYPNIVTEFAMIRTDADGTMTELTTDNGETYTLNNPQPGYSKEVLYRVVCGYVPDGQTATLYQVTGAYLLRDSTELACEPDPIRVTSVWQSGRFINMHLSPLTGGGQQYWGFRIDDTSGRTTHVSLHHRQNGDPLSYTEAVYASLSVDSLKAVPAGATVVLHINTFKGDQTWSFQKP